MKTLPFLVLLLSLPALAGEAPAPAASEKEDEGGKTRQGGLEDKIRPVSGNLFLKEKRFEISPTLHYSLADSFFQKLGAGVKLDYHVMETFAVGVYVSYSIAFPSPVVNVCRSTRNDDNTVTVDCSTPKLGDLKDVPGKVGLLGGLEVSWAPIYGKVNVMAEKVLHFDLGVSAGGGVVQYQTPGGGSTMTFAGFLGLGQRYFMTRSVTLRIELRDYMYSSQTVPLGNSTSKLEHQLMLELGVSFFAGEPPSR